MESTNSLVNKRNSAESTAAFLHAQLSDETLSSTLELAPCGSRIVAQLRESAHPSCAMIEAHLMLKHLETTSEDDIKSIARTHKAVPLHVRRLYADCRLLHSLLELRDPAAEYYTEEMWLLAVRRLDMAIIVSGAPGEGRLDLIIDTIELIQSKYLPLADSTVESDIRILSSPTSNPLPATAASIALNSITHIAPPTFSTFHDKFSLEPFIIPGFIRDWPALNNHPWRSSGYLERIAGRGRTVPVEVGSDYRAEEWDQKLMSWEEFLRGIGMNNHLDIPVYSEDARFDAGDGRSRKELLYLAQHTLLTQFPALRSDIIVPDYVYSSLPAPATFPAYRPPDNDEQLVINAWLGPSGTVSPAHTDPYFNCFAQVVGRKTIWLAPPRFQEEMYPFLAPHAPHTARNTSAKGSSRNAGVQKAEPSLANTSRVDVFTPSDMQFPLFEVHVRPQALCAVLEPGDMLYIPPGWWHAMRSEDVSFSVSMWF